jgi:hypothetical protein
MRPQSDGIGGRDDREGGRSNLIPGKDGRMVIEIEAGKLASGFS